MIKRLWSKISVRLISLCMIIVVIVLYGSSVYAKSYVSGILQENLIELYSSTLYQSALQISSVQEDVIQFGTMVMANESVQNGISPSSTDTVTDYILQRSNMVDILGEYVTGEETAISIDIVLNDEKIFTSFKSNTSGALYTTDTDWIADTLDSTSGFSVAHDIDPYGNGSPVQVYTWYKQFNNYVTTQSNYAIIYVHFDTSNIEQFLEDGLPDYDWLMLCNENGEILYSSQNVEIDLYALTLQEDFDNYFENTHTITADMTYFSSTQLEDGWRLLLAVPNDNIQEQISYISHFFSRLILITVIIGCILLMIVLTRLTKPIRALTETAEKVSAGDYEVRAQVNSQDEVGVLAIGFNEMLDNLQEQEQKLLQMERTKADLKIGLLMAQINPHFIYNTLNSAIYLIDMGQNKRASTLCRRFVKLLQNNLKSGPEGIVISIEDEIDSIQNYLEIQEIRYPNRFIVDIATDQAATSIYIPRMILQPLVENALFHGVLPEEKCGTISLSVTKQENYLYIDIADNGVGMTQAQIDHLFRQQYQPEHIGFNNVYRRLQLVYKDQFTMDVTSAPLCGTKIHIALPLSFTETVLPIDHLLT